MYWALCHMFTASQPWLSSSEADVGDAEDREMGDHVGDIRTRELLGGARHAAGTQATNITAMPETTTAADASQAGTGSVRTGIIRNVLRCPGRNIEDSGDRHGVEREARDARIPDVLVSRAPRVGLGNCLRSGGRSETTASTDTSSTSSQSPAVSAMASTPAVTTQGRYRINLACSAKLSAI